ncbi:SgcJ/EcaC family oxidoreductase [Catalinimonas sp. 4WD22]|uniref:YybH family protein n=1 Tax=Catalinimonas locisalis TaxID=3133978 RepID=UPI003100DEB9
MHSISFTFKLFALCFILYSAACTSETQHTTVSSAEDVEAITAVSAARAEAFNNSNSAGIAEHFTEDAILMAPGEAARTGRAAVQDYYQSIFDDYEVTLDSHYEEVEVSGDMAYGRGEATVTLTPQGGGETTSSTSKYLNILKRQPDGSWKTTHDVWNANE